MVHWWPIIYSALYFCYLFLTIGSHHTEVPTPWPALQPRSPPALAKGPRHWTSLFRDPPPPPSSALVHSTWDLTAQEPLWTWVITVQGPLLVTSGGQDWRPVQTCSLEDNPPVLTSDGKWSLGQGNIFRSVCQEFCSQGGGLPHCMLGYSAGSRPPQQCMLGDTGNKRAVRILLERCFN